MDCDPHSVTYQIPCILDIYIVIHNSNKITVKKYQYGGGGITKT